ncbi:hypothetical protein [Clostridium sp.]|uniref:hypothetical protein n=1 Tax=Clostridium sp. TaxID=1506 RepID=UPI002FCB8523
MKVDFKNGRVFNTICTIAYIILSYVFTLWFGLEFMIFDFEVLSAAKFFVIYIIFVLSVLWLLKVSNSKIVSVTIGGLSVIYLKEYVQGPISTFLNSKIGGTLQSQSIVSLGFLAQVVFIILNLIILFFAILKLHELFEVK